MDLVEQMCFYNLLSGLNVFQKYHNPEVVVVQSEVIVWTDDDVLGEDKEKLEECGWQYSPKFCYWFL